MKLDLKFSEKIEILKGGTFLLCDEAGTEVVAVAVGEETIFTATENDIRKGTVAATDKGITTGEKVIPSYHTTEGVKVVTNGSMFETLPFTDLPLYDFTKFQAIICPFSESLNGSVAAEKVAINEGVYAVNSTELLSTVIKDSDSKKIKLGISNQSGKTYLMRYFTYKEIN